MYRQGDVLLVRSIKPEGGQVVKSRIIAEGEATGHHHRFNDCAEVMTIGDMIWVVAGDGAELTHQEHDTIIVDPGTYRVIHQREYTPERVRRVID